MATLEQLSDYAQTAQAAYATGLVSGANNTGAFVQDADMSASQATQFNDTWNVLSQSTPTTSSFSAVLLQNRLTGEKVLSIAGTGGLVDLTTDLINIAVLGSIVAYPQYISLLNFYSQLVRDGQLTASEQFTVTGHSSGGFLAQAFAVIHSNVVTHAYTYNAPGFGGTTAQLLDYFGVLPDSLPGNTITNVRASEGWSFTAGAGVTIGETQQVHIEGATINQLDNHKIYRLADSLAVQSVLSVLDPTISLTTTGSLFQSASSVRERSIESLLDSTLRVLVGDITTGTDDRDSLYTNLQGLRNSLAVGGSLHALAGALHISSASSVLASEAKTEFSALFALQTLSTVVLRGSNTANQTLLDSTLGGVHAGTYALWQADQGLSATDRAAGKANFSDSWLSDRATMLNLLVQRNTSDTFDPLNMTLSGGIANTYIDLATGTTIETGTAAGANKPKIVFGTEGDDSYWGGSGSDRIYGGTGADQLYGQGGDDYLEGGSGNDALTSGTGRDVLNGGAGFDAYWISSGESSATIMDADGSGSILIERPDGSSYTLGTNIEEVTAGSSICQDDEDNRYVLRGNDLLIQIKNGGQQITVKDYASMSGSRLGLNVQTATPDTFVTTRPTGFDNVTTGTEGADAPGVNAHDPNTGLPYNKVYVTTLGGDDYVWGTGDYDLPQVTVVDAGAGLDYVEVDGVNVWINGEADNDVLVGVGGSATLTGGTGADVLFGLAQVSGEAGDRLFGETEMSVATAMAAGDVAVSQTNTGDLLTSNGLVSADVLVGGDARDVLAGGGGQDQLIGGGGDDLILGDRYYVFEGAYIDPHWNSLQWDFTAGITVNADGSRQVNYAVTSYIEYNFSNGSGGFISSNDNFHDYATPQNAAADTIYAGTGNDLALAGGGDDFIDGGAGNDSVFGEQGNDTILGQAGDDELSGDGVTTNNGSDFVDGGDGNDKLWGGGGADVLYGGANDDTLYGDDENPNDGDDYLNGEDGNDTLSGSGGSDTLIGGEGADNLYGDSSTTADARQGNDYLDGGADDDLLVGWGGADTLIGGTGNDQLDGDGATVTENKQADDFLDGGEGNDVLNGNGGADVLLGGAGDDSLYGDATDTPVAVQGSDYLDGGAGDDILVGSGGSDTLLGGDGNDQLVGDEISVPSQYQGRDYLSGGAGNDVMWGQGDSDLLFGDDGNDQLSGDDGDDELHGGEGGDLLIGGAGNDVLNGGLGIDVLQGGAGDDSYVFNSEDLLISNNVADSVNDTEGNNRIIISSGIDSSNVTVSISASGGFAVTDANYTHGLIIQSGHSQFELADGVSIAASQLVGQKLTTAVNRASALAGDYLIGGTRADTLIALGNNARISGGRGNDALTGNNNSTTYRFEIGDGVDSINDPSSFVQSNGTNINTIEFGEGIDLSSLSLSLNLSSNQLTLQVGAAGDGMTLGTSSTTDLAGGTRTIDQIRFADGTVKSWAELVAATGVIINTGASTNVNGTNVADHIVGSAANQTINAGAGDDLIESKAGNDTLDGGAGSDTYKFSRGDGNDTILNSDAAATSVDVLLFADDIRPADVDFMRSGSNLLAAIKNSTDFMYVSNYFTTGTLDEIRFADGTVYSSTTVPVSSSNLIATPYDDVLVGTAAADSINGLAGNDEIHGGDGSDTLNGGIGNDILLGEAGNDVLSGDSGNDTYRFGYGSGTDIIVNHDTSTMRNDVLEFGAGITPGDLLFSRGVDVEDGGLESDANALVIQLRGSTDKVIVHYYFYDDTAGGYALDAIRFSDGTIWNRKAINDLFLPLGTEYSDYLYAFSTDATLRGLGGDDTLSGGIGNDQLFGDGGRDTLQGYDGNDSLEGGSGTDLLYGGKGNDTYHFGHNADGDRVIETDGNDRVLLDAGILPSDVQLYRDSNSRDGDLVLVLDGGANQMRITSHYSSNTDRIESIEFANGTIWDSAAIASRITNLSGVANTQTGTSGNDTFVVDHVDDRIAETAGGGTDTVLASVDFILANNVENLTLQGFFNINAFGNSLDNVITGNQGDNILHGYAGADTLIGGAGDDTYYISQYDNYGYGDIVVEEAGGGIDWVYSGVSFVLPNAVEQLTLTGGSHINGTGNALDNVLIGNDSDNILDGGAGADLMMGGAGSDTYVVDNALDLIVETASSIYTDTVQSSITYILPNNLENLTLVGTAAINGTGNDSGNTLDGSTNTAVNTLTGGLGDDRYRIGIGDIIIENPDQGLDTVVINAGTVRTYALSEFANIENIELGGVGASGALGDSNNNKIVGNPFSNTLDGGAGDDYIIDQYATGGGFDTDILIGGDGNDQLTSYYGNDTLDGGGGNDLMRSYGSSSVAYIFGRNYGDDIIRGAFNNSTISLAAGISASAVLLSRNGTDLILRIDGDAGSLRVEQFFTDATNYQPQNIIAGLTFSDGTSWNKTTIANRVRALYGSGSTSGDDAVVGTSGADVIDALAGNDFVYGSAGNDSIEGSAGNDELWGEQDNDVLSGSDGSDSLYGGRGQDVLIGGSGDDALHGGADADSYLFNTGCGLDVIQDSDDPSNEDIATDEIVFGAGISPGDIQLSFTNNVLNKLDLFIKNLVTGDQIVLKYFYGAEVGSAMHDHIEKIRFADGTTWDLLKIRQIGAQLFGTNGDDGFMEALNSLSSRLYGGGGNDYLNGHSGDDLLDGGVGNDTMIGGTGNDTYIVDNSGDVVTENSSEGADTVQSAITYTLGSNVENLSLSGLANINGTGNSLSNVITGNGSNNTLNGGTGADTLIGGAGDDTYVVDNAGDVATENMGEGTDLVQSSVTYTLSANVENMTLTGSSAINATGNALNNVLTGNSGANILDGGVGVDTMVGGAGNDTYIADNVADITTEAASAGTDLVQSSVTYTLANNVENLTLTGAIAINGTGNTLNNTLTGNSAANVLDGGSGTDTLIGGVGSDTYIVDSTGDVVTENANEGTDLVQSSVTLTLAANVENLTLTGTSAINGTGNTFNNTIAGNSAANTLDGGAGSDTLVGGAGNDTYIVDNATDVVTENANEGTDVVQSSATYTLAANIETLTLTATAAINGTGNALNNTINGNSGNNVLDGGAGADTLVGGAGNDTYVVDNTSDVVTEAASAGTDLVQSSVTYTLATNVENLTLTGTATINGTGNTLTNMLTGNSANNILDGGTGADTLIGGAGNDTYVVDNGSDVVTESASEGIDLIQSSATYTIGSNVENLTLTGSSAINGTGNTLDNVLTGNSANNTLTGAAGNDTLDGGAGTDTMLGGTGNDVYYVDVSADVTMENANEGIDLVNSAVTRTLASNIELLFLTGTSTINGTGNTLANLLRGNTANNTLAGAGGTDILESGAGTDTLSNTSGNTLLNGGAGTDTLTGTSNNDLLIGGTGNDSLTTGSGADIIVFNKGDGQDTVAASTTKDNTLAIGGGTLYADLLFSKSGNNLILKIGATDQITFTNYYSSTSNRSVDKLQVVLEGSSDYNAGSSNAMYNKKIETFDFGGLVSAFDAALAANPSLTSWALSNALASKYLSGSDTAAIGGDLAYQYGRYGNLSNVSFTPALSILGASGFGTAAQTLQSLSSLQDSSPRLN